ncbi:MAG: efflux RND transporter periplasmic adaptor subunit [Betaproteobacteria bacterium]|nr:efflux RND transporter periplasmic adaptor subunit [Betaproteobacteria bacterium]
MSLSQRSFRMALAALVVLAAAGVLIWFRAFRPLTVKVAHIEANVPEQVFGLGVVGTRVESNLGFKVPGVLSSLLADEGQHVRAGQLLARLESRDVKAQLSVDKANVAQARANIAKAHAAVESAAALLANARAVAARSRRLIKAGGVSEEQLQNDRAASRVAAANLAIARSDVGVDEAALRAAKAQVAAQQAVLGYYALHAPYDAWIVSRNLELGSAPAAGQSVFTIVAAHTIWVLAYVDERLAGDLRVGDPARITLRSQANRPLAGHVARIEVQSDPVNEERLVDIAFDRVPRNIHLAEQAEAVITTGHLARALAVPQTAVGDLKNHGGWVWTVEHGRLARRHVEFGRQLLNGRLPIRGGLPQGVAVVVAPVPGMRAGRAARPEPESTP